MAFEWFVYFKQFSFWDAKFMVRVSGVGFLDGALDISLLVKPIGHLLAYEVMFGLGERADADKRLTDDKYGIFIARVCGSVEFSY